MKTLTGKKLISRQTLIQVISIHTLYDNYFFIFYFLFFDLFTVGANITPTLPFSTMCAFSRPFPPEPVDSQRDRHALAQQALEISRVFWDVPELELAF